MTPGNNAENKKEPAEELDQHETRIVLDSIADGVFTVDRDYFITFFNKSAERITGVATDQALGQKCYDVFRADICQHACALRETIETGSNIVNRKVNILNTAGERVPASISTAVLRDEEGRIKGGVETFRDLSEVEKLRRDLQGSYSYADIISKNEQMQRLFEILPDVAEAGSPVLIQGPSGSGKELFARAVHELSPRREKRFVPISCGAFPDTLLESELFGYKKGAFTDAKSDKPGRFALAEGGTLFLDEIAEISPAMQVKLLRVLQEYQYEPLGSNEAVNADVRIVAATNKNLSERVSTGEFREDLYYRLNVVKLQVPPLAQRRDDIPLLTRHFIEEFNARTQKHIEGVSPEAWKLLLAYDYPGNVRELQNIIEHAFVLCRESEIDVQHLPPEVDKARREDAPSSPGENVQEGDSAPRTKSRSVQDAELAAIREALARNNGHRRKTAEELGIDKSTLWRKMKRYGITFPANSG